MNQETPIEDKRSFLRNDRLLVCSMLIVYGLCIVGLVAATIWGLGRRSKEISAIATGTAAARTTQQAAATATLAARATQQAQYSYIERFDDNRHAWRVEAVNDEYARGSLEINGGVYIWNMREIKQPFYDWAAFPAADWDSDFDTYVDLKVDADAPDDVCGGFLFRTASIDWEEGTYVFSVCNTAYFYVSYYKEEKWDAISGWLYSDAIQRNDWNRLEINARGNDFTFIINNQVVFKMTDDRQPAGRLSLLVEVTEKKPTIIWFDNFGFQHR